MALSNCYATVATKHTDYNQDTHFHQPQEILKGIWVLPLTVTSCKSHLLILQPIETISTFSTLTYMNFTGVISL